MSNARHISRGISAITQATPQDESKTADVAAPQLPDDQYSHWWDWDHPSKPRVHYWQMGQSNSGPPVLLLHGFGVGSFHWERCMLQLAERGHRVWALDFIGQGRSWPRQATGVTYSVDLWTEQVKAFIDEVIREDCFVCGNSLGGFVAASFAALYPKKVLGVILVNATPWWAFNPAVANLPGVTGVAGQIATTSAAASAIVAAVDPQPSESTESLRNQSQSMSESVGSTDAVQNSSSTQQRRGGLWSGMTPAPAYVRNSVGWLWRQLRSTATVQKTLRQVYTQPDLVDAALADRILEAAEHPLAFDAFLSILFAPQAAGGGLDDMLRRYSLSGGQLLLLYGREDPWVRNVWGQRILRVIPDATFVQLSPSGHCPHDEAPDLFAQYLSSWANEVSHQAPPLLQIGDEVIREGITMRRVDDSPSNALEYVVWSVYVTTSAVQRTFAKVFGQQGHEAGK